MKHLNIILVIISVGLNFACSKAEDLDSLSANNKVLTWSKDIRPIFENRCTVCHTSEAAVNILGIPVWTDEEFGVDGSALVAMHIKDIRLFVEDGTMPMSGNITNMTQDEREKVIRWIDEGLFL